VSDDEDGRYEFEGAVSVAGPPEAVLHALVTPELMARWMVGVDSVSDAGDGAGSRVEVVASLGSRYGRAGWRYLGEVVERSPTTLVREYQLSETRAGVLASPVAPAEYHRTVRYTLRPDGDQTGVRCTVTTRIPGLARAAARRGGRSEARSLECSLQRLRDVVHGTTRSPLVRWLRGSGQSPQPF